MANWVKRPGLGSYMKSRDQQNKEAGKIWCPIHPGTWYDPKRFKRCFHCNEALKKQKGVSDK